MAPGLQHLEERRPDARGSRDERRDLPRRGQRVQRTADVHSRQPQARRDRSRSRHLDDELSPVDDPPRHDQKARRARRHRGSKGSAGVDDSVSLLPGARLYCQSLSLESGQRLFEPVRGVEPHTALQASGVHRAPRFCAVEVPPRRLPAQALRRAASVERRNAAGRAARRAQSRVNLYAKLREREAQGRPLRVGMIGAGKFAAMYIAQVPKTPGVHLVGIADLSPDYAKQNLHRVGWAPEAYAAKSLDAALKEKRTHLSDDWQALVAHPAIDIVIEATGNPPAAVEHALGAFRNGKHVVMVTVEADAFCGPLLARKAAEAGVVYSLAYGDQPAIICDLVDWARAAGFPVVAAGRGHKWLPHYAQSTPETVWQYYGLTPEQARVGGLNPKMFNSFLDGSKPAIEAAAVCNATGLTPAPGGLSYPSASIDALPQTMRPKAEGGCLHHKGQVEVVSSLERDGQAVPHDIRFGVWVVFEGESDYIRRCFMEYGVHTDPSGRYACMYKRWHLIGLEAGISVASVGLRREPTGCATGFRADAVATAKRDLRAGELLDGEGGYTVVGRLLPAADSLTAGALPLGLAHGWTLTRPVAAGELVRWADVVVDEANSAVRARREMEQMCTAR